MATRRVGLDDPVPGTHIGPPRIVNRHGEEIKLSTSQKNALYRQAKDIREKMVDRMCTRHETHRTDERTVRKMLHSEFANHDKMTYYNKAMKAVGAVGREVDLNNYRRRGS